MLTLLAIALACGGWRFVRTVRESLAWLPRRNEDMVLF